MAKISVQQRKYFVERIQTSIDEKISILKQQRAADVQQISELEYKRYLKTIKLDKTLSKYKKTKDEFDLLGGRITAVYDEILESMGKRKYDSNVPSLYSGADYSNIDKAFRFLCSKTAQSQETETESGKMIKELESKKRAACDILHGISDLEELTGEVNTILKGSGVPMLGA